MDGSTFTVRPMIPNQASVTLTVDAQTRIKINNRQLGTLANLATILAQANAARRPIHVTAQYLPTGAGGGTAHPPRPVSAFAPP